MTEIPEHLLKRSRERRAALGLGGDDATAGESAPAAAAPATTTPAAAAPAATAPAERAAAPAPAAPPPPKPDSYVVAAYKRRKKIPVWAMLALSLLPIWAFMYVRAVTEQEVHALGPLGEGAEVFGGCASCHGADGGGAVGYAFTGGAVLETFPHIEDQLRFVYFGTDQYLAAGVENYGNPDREGGPHLAGGVGTMPQQGALAGGGLTDAEILSVVCHERYTLGGADPSGDFAEEFETWCAEGSEIFADLEAGGDLTTLEGRFEEIIPIGTEPAPGSPPGDE